MSKKNNNKTFSRGLSVADQSVLALRNIRFLLKQKGKSSVAIETELMTSCPDAHMLDQVYRLNGFKLGQ